MTAHPEWMTDSWLAWAASAYPADDNTRALAQEVRRIRGAVSQERTASRRLSALVDLLKANGISLEHLSAPLPDYLPRPWDRDRYFERADEALREFEERMARRPDGA